MTNEMYVLAGLFAPPLIAAAIVGWIRIIKNLTK